MRVGARASLAQFFGTYYSIDSVVERLEMKAVTCVLVPRLMWILNGCAASVSFVIFVRALSCYRLRYLSHLNLHHTQIINLLQAINSILFRPLYILLPSGRIPPLTLSPPTLPLQYLPHPHFLLSTAVVHPARLY